jgi:hypothetical protein
MIVACGVGAMLVGILLNWSVPMDAVPEPTRRLIAGAILMAMGFTLILADSVRRR